jgi:multicomponent K+:H+ antiporter subunit D
VLVIANAGPVSRYADAAAAQLLDRRAYLAAVLGAEPVPPMWTPRAGMQKQ